MVCPYDRRACCHVRLGMQSRWGEVNGGAGAVSPAVRQCRTPSQVAAGGAQSCPRDTSPIQGHCSSRALAAFARLPSARSPRNSKMRRGHLFPRGQQPRGRHEFLCVFSMCREIFRNLAVWPVSSRRKERSGPPDLRGHRSGIYLPIDSCEKMHSSTDAPDKIRRCRLCFWRATFHPADHS
jgi:hypothetical protein